MASNKRSKCLITLFAILPSEKDKANETLKIFYDLSNGNKDILHLQKDVYLPKHQKDDLFGTVIAVKDLKQESIHKKNKKNKKNNKNEKKQNDDFMNCDNNNNNIDEDNYWYLELSGNEIVYHKHECLVRNVDFISISSNFQSLLNYLGHFHSFSYIQKGIKYFIRHYNITIHIYSLQQIFDNNSKSPLEKENKQIIEMFIEVNFNSNESQIMEKTEKKLLNFSKIFEHLHWFKIKPSRCKKIE